MPAATSRTRSAWWRMARRTSSPLPACRDPSECDGELVDDRPDARCRPGRALGIFALSPRPNGATQGDLTIGCLDDDVLRIHLGAPAQRTFYSLIDVGRGCDRR